jgi:hypothetical protein
MRHQRRNGHGLKHPARNAAQNALLQARMAVAAHDDQIETGVGCDRQNCRLDIRVICTRALDLRRKAMPGQMCCQGRRGGIGRCLCLVDADDGDRLRASQKRRSVTNGARRQSASVPRDPDAPRLKRTPVRIGYEKNRTTGLKRNFSLAASSCWLQSRAR